MSSATTAAPPAASARVARVRLYVALGLFLCGFAAGTHDFFHAGASGFGQGNEMAAIGRSLAAKGVFGNPFEPHVTGPTAANPPLYPLLLGALIKLFGEPGYALAATLLNLLLNAGIAAMLPRVAQVACGDWRAGAVAGLLWISAMRLLPAWDTTATVAGLLAFCLVGAWEIEDSKSGVLAGMVGGVVTLLNPATALIVVPWALWLGLRRDAPRRVCVRHVAVVVASIVVCNAPWVARNYRVWGAPILRTNFGYTIYCSNNDCARPSLFASIAAGCYQRTHPSASADEVALLQSLGEIEYDRLRTRDTFDWIRRNPARFGRLTGARMIEFWFPDPGATPRTNYAIWLITALSIPGLAMMFRRRETVAWFIAASWLLYPLMFYIVVSCDRYRHPLLWTSLLPAGYFVARVWARSAAVSLK